MIAAANKVQQKGAASTEFVPFVVGGLPAAGAAVVAKKTCQHVPDEAKVSFLHSHACQKNPSWPRQKVRLLPFAPVPATVGCEDGGPDPWLRCFGATPSSPEVVTEDWYSGSQVSSDSWRTMFPPVFLGWSGVVWVVEGGAGGGVVVV